MAYIYLIGDADRDGFYKIGSTRHDDVEKRLKQLQTGNSGELFLYKTFKTDDVFQLEGMLHRNYHPNQAMGEWFELNENDLSNFLNECEKYQGIIDSLKDNPFYKKKGQSR